MIFGEYHLGNVSLPPANEVCKGYVFTCVCVPTRGSTWAGTSPDRFTTPQQVPLGRYPLAGTASQAGNPPSMYTPGQVPPGALHAGRYGQQAGGTHPTGIHSCCFLSLMENFRRWKKDLSGLVKRDSDQEFKENFFFQISSFLQRIHHDKIGVTVFKLFVVDKSAILTVSKKCKIFYKFMSCLWYIQDIAC